VAREKVDERTIGGGLAVGDRPALQHQPSLGSRRVAELPDQPRLADSGFPKDGDDLAMAGAGPRQRLAEPSQFGVASGEAGEAPGGRRLNSGPSGRDPDELEHLDRLRQSLDRDPAGRDDPDEALG